MSIALQYEIKNSLFIIKASGVWRMRMLSLDDASMLATMEDEIVDHLERDVYTSVHFEYEQPNNTQGDAQADSQQDSHNWDSMLLSMFTIFIHQAEIIGKGVDYSSLSDGMQKLLVHLTDVDKKCVEKEIFLSKIGSSILSFPKKFHEAINFLGDIMGTLFLFFRGKASCTSRDVWQEIYSCGVGSLAIISLVSFLFGLILTFVSALQLRLLGTEVYVASFVSLSTVRVMGPFLTAIVVAGKIGASYAATIGTMKVNEEVDALETFGISPMQFLILPRVFALVIMMPLLTMYANFMSIFGGVIVASLWLEISPIAFLENVRSLATMHYLWVGLLHSFFFGAVIALSSCYQGISCGQDAEAVGIATTKAVVNSIVGIIITTAIITVLFSFVGM